MTLTAHDIDAHVGTRIRERRTMLGWTQQQLAEQIGVTYQQQHKYERGINRVSASTLYRLSAAMGCEVGWFFDGLAGTGNGALAGGPRETLDVARNFAGIRDENARAAVSQLCRALAG